MPDSSDHSTAQQPPPRRRPTAPWSRFVMWRRQRFEREREEVRAYLRVATPLGLRASKLYEDWREAVAEPVQDNQKAANASATFWWRITEGLRRFETLTPPEPARRYHSQFAEAMRNASLGSEAAKNGFRAGKSYEVSRGLGFLDLFVEQMGVAESELGRLVVKYRLLDEAVEEYRESEEASE